MRGVSPAQGRGAFLSLRGEGCVSRLRSRGLSPAKVRGCVSAQGRGVCLPLRAVGVSPATGRGVRDV